MNCWFTRGYFLNKKDWGLPEPMIQVPWDPQDKSKTPSQVTWTASKAWGFWPLWGPKATGKLWRVHPPESCETSIKMHTSQRWWPFFYTSQDTMVFLTTCGIRMFPWCELKTMADETLNVSRNLFQWWFSKSETSNPFYWFIHILHPHNSILPPCHPIHPIRPTLPLWGPKSCDFILCITMVSRCFNVNRGCAKTTSRSNPNYFVWSPPWHLYILLLANLLAFYLTFYLAFYLAYLLAFYLAYLLAFYLAYLLAFYLAYLLACYLANLLAFYLANILALYLAYLLAFYLAFYLAYLLAFYPAYLLAYVLAYLPAFYLAYLLAYYLANLLAFYLANILALYLAYLLAFYDLTFYLAFYLAYLLAFYLAYLPTWGPAGNTWRGYSRLRSGREHWAGMVVVEVRQGTLSVDGRGWGPAGNTGRGYSRLRSGREHWAGMVVVEVRQGTLSVDGRGWGPAGHTERGSRLSRRRRGEEERRSRQLT